MDNGFFGPLTDTMPESAIEWRVHKSGTSNDGKPWIQVVPYASARWLMDRLDQVLGPGGWQTRMEVVDTGGMIERVDKNGEVRPEWSPPSILCGLGIQTNGEWVWKWDAAEFTDFSPTKGGATHAFRRSCVPWNVGGIRRLYEAEGVLWAKVREGGSHESYLGQKLGKVRWDPPVLFGPNGLLGDGANHPRGLGEPISKETREQIENLFRPVEEMLSASEKKAVTEAMKDTEERGQKAIGFLNDRIAELNAAAAQS